jgi:peptidoglycan-associated lipoprotein
LASALEADGASASQIKVVSYGEERPVCREHNEDCWKQNRRDNIVYTAE